MPATDSFARECQHVLLTRFNIWTSFSTPDDRRLDDAYLEDRLRLFERYCLPSVAGQTCRSFRWVLLLDDGTPPWVQQRIAAYPEASALLFPVYVTREAMIRSEDRMWGFIREHVDAGQRWLLSTRLDSDDAIATDFIGTIQANVTRSDRFLNIPRGYYYVEASNGLYEARHTSNPFISRLEDLREGEPGTILSVDHTEIRRMADITQIGTAPGWLVVVHGANVSNRPIAAQKRVARSRLRGTFALASPRLEESESSAAIQLENCLRPVDSPSLPRRALRLLARVMRGLRRRLQGSRQ